MTTASEIITRAARIIHDEKFSRWSKAEMLDWASEAQIVVARNPGVYNRTVVIDLDKGSRQHLPDDGWSLITVTSNLDGGVPVSAVKITTRELLDAFCPMWHRMPTQQLVENYIYDNRRPTEFSVYPPNDGTGHIEVVYMAIPARFTSDEDELVVDDTYIPALVNYIVYRAYCKESEYAPGIQNAQAYFAAYQQELLSALSVRDSTTPNSTLMKTVGMRGALTTAAVGSNGSTE